MKLYLVRHAVAQEDAPEGDDRRRALTARGRERFRACVDGLDRLGVRFERVVTSPWLRAVETTELLVRLCDEDATARTEVALELTSSPDDALLERCAHVGVERLALVGHEPFLSQLALWLVTGWRSHADTPADAGFALKKGGVLVLEGEPRPGGMRLVAAYPPSALRKLARR